MTSAEKSLFAQRFSALKKTSINRESQGAYKGHITSGLQAGIEGVKIPDRGQKLCIGDASNWKGRNRKLSQNIETA